MNTTASKRHPSGLYLLYFTEMWERFSYYGMRAIFTLYMINALLFDKALASKVYGSYTGLVYLTPLLGGYIADRYWGNRRSSIFGGALMASGQFFMFMSGSTFEDVETAKLLMYSGLGFLIFGNGFFKPNISTMVGQLYEPGDRRVDSAFTIFYQGINMGALLAPAICGSLGERYNEAGIIIPTEFKWGFLAACIGMILSLIAFVWLKNKYVVTPSGEPVGMPPVKEIKTSEESKGSSVSITKMLLGVLGLAGLYFLFNSILAFDEIGSVIFASCIVLPAIIITEPSLTKIEKQRIWVIFIIAFFVIFFWSAFEQAGASLTFFAQEQTDRNILGWNMPASMFQIFNALFIVLLAPAAVSVWNWLGKRGNEPSSPVKQSMGLGFLALGYLFIAWGVNGIQPWDKVSMVWLVGLYLIHTVGELCLSPIGLSMVVKLAPTRFVSLLMGVWFMSTATANKFAGDLSALYPEEVKIAESTPLQPDKVPAMDAILMDTAVWKLSLKDSVELPVVKVSFNDTGAMTQLEQVIGQKKKVSYYNLYLVKLSNNSITSAAVTEDGRYLLVDRTVKSKDEKGNTVSARQAETWDMTPVKPSFLGMKINNLFDFFMIFVYMAGASAVLLFSIRNFLLKNMHGIR